MRKLLGILAFGVALAGGVLAGFAVPVPGMADATQTYQGTVDTTRLAQASAELEIGGDNTTLVAQGLPQTAGVYKTWVMRPDAEAPEPSVEFVPSDGWASVELPGVDLEDVEAVLVTREPAPGATAPSEQPVVVIVLTTAAGQEAAQVR